MNEDIKKLAKYLSTKLQALDDKITEKLDEIENVMYLLTESLEASEDETTENNEDMLEDNEKDNETDNFSEELEDINEFEDESMFDIPPPPPDKPLPPLPSPPRPPQPPKLRCKIPKRNRRGRPTLEEMEAAIKNEDAEQDKLDNTDAIEDKKDDETPQKYDGRRKIVIKEHEEAKKKRFGLFKRNKK